MKSLLDTDFYILTMMQAIFHRYTNVHTEFTFKWRNWDKMKMNITVKDFIGRVNEKLDAMCEVRLQKDEHEYLREVPFLKADFLEYLRLFQLNRGYIRAYVGKQGDHEIPAIDIAGPLLNVIPFEVPVLASVSSIYTQHHGDMSFNWQKKGMELLDAKLDFLSSQLHRDAEFKFADFGTRRRANYEWHGRILEHLVSRAGHLLAGTSNVHFAKKYGIKYIGTMAHLWFQVHQQLTYRLIDSQRAALQAWADEYRGELGIALSDTLSFDMFLCDFDRYFALLFDGCRHDSGDPHVWAEKLIAHYEKLRINPKSKVAVFSDGLTFDSALRLYYDFHHRINTSFGIGTYLTNDCGFVAPQIVIKNTKTNGKPTAKISDSAGKGMCQDDEFEGYLKKIIAERIANHK
jgi:nicotinate phosphoribosyltransferase